MDLLDRMNRYSSEASWAVWERTPEGALTGVSTFPNDAVHDLNPTAIFVSLNPARAGVQSANEHAPDWANFHSPNQKHNDMFLAHALVDTEYWGSYMTDLHPQIRESNSSRVRPTTAEIAEAVQRLIDQALELGRVKTIIGVGSASFRSLSRHAPAINAALPDVRILQIPHYSKANARVHKQKPELYKARVHEQLGI